MNIKLVQRHEIDDQRWNKIVAGAANGTIYGYTFYLDSVAKQWMALIADEYQFILPLPCSRKSGFLLLMNPLFCQRVAIYSTQEVTCEVAEQFLKQLSSIGDFVQLSLDLPLDTCPEYFSMKQRSNFVLNLDREYSEIYKRYSKDARKSLRTDLKITVEPFIEFDTIIDDYIQSFRELKKWKLNHFTGLKKAIRYGNEQKMMKSYQVLLDGERIASGIFFIANHKAFYVLGSPTKKGKKINAIHFLIDHFIREHAFQLDALDFEGSDIPSVAYFYKKWGSENNPYYQIIQSNSIIVSTVIKLLKLLRQK